MSKTRKRTYGHRDITICLDAELGSERDALIANKRKSPDEAKRLKQIEEEMRESLLTIRVVGVPRAQYAKIQGAHPGKPGTMQAFNPDTFFSDFIYKTGFEVEDDGNLSKLSEWNRSEWDEIADGLTDGEYTDLASAVFDLNKTRPDTGFLSRGSASTEPSSPISEQPEPGE